MSIKCKKCGCDALIKTDDWYKCPNCGTVMFDTDVKINNVTSPTKEMEKMDSAVQPQDADIKQTEERVPSAAQPGSDDGENAEAKKGKNSKKSKKNKAKDDNGDGEKPKKSKGREVVEFLIPIVLAVVIALLLKNFVFANAVVPTGSMLNTIQEGDRIIASRLSYINDDPERYDIIIFKFPDDESEYFVKRIIGLPGETVQVVNGTVYVTKTDGETIMLDDSFVTNCEPAGNFGPYIVPEDSYFVMGDNRNNSWDSRYWTNTYVNREKIVGKVKFKYYPGISSIE